jgi:hypothetical protein
MKRAGIIIILIGLILTIFTTFSFFTREEVVKIGDLKITANKPHSFRWSPFIGIAVMAVGGVFVWQGSKR